MVKIFLVAGFLFCFNCLKITWYLLRVAENRCKLQAVPEFCRQWSRTVAYVVSLLQP